MRKLLNIFVVYYSSSCCFLSPLASVRVCGSGFSQMTNQQYNKNNMKVKIFALMVSIAMIQKMTTIQQISLYYTEMVLSWDRLEQYIPMSMTHIII